MSKFAEYSDVVIATDRFADEGVPRGSVAVVLEVYPGDAYELQAFDDAGNTIGLFSARADDLAAATLQQ